MTKRRTGDHPDLKMVNHAAAAIDIGSTMHMAAVNPDTDAMPVRAFGIFTHDLHELVDWFRSRGVTSVAMESIGVNWIPAFEILEAHGFEVILVNARYTKNVQAAKPMWATRDGCASCIPAACSVAVSALRPRSPPSGLMCASANV